MRHAFSPRKVIRLAIPLIIFSVVVFLGIYGAVQQDMRQSANDPQIQLAEDASATFSKNRVIMYPQPTDIAASLEPFVMSFDKNGKTIYSSGSLDGKTPVVPSGVFTTTAQKGETRFTWEPKTGVRIAAVVVWTKNGYILSGRNIREVENRESALGHEMLLGWVISVIAIVGGSLLAAAL
ncbi:MAG TPA: hypothetical protein VN711_00545 [Candidatus Saccharimonadales bacterium]|nr:hypothetical protein [Candidatus Saccharimonadales bacterium]